MGPEAVISHTSNIPQNDVCNDFVQCIRSPASLSIALVPWIAVAFGRALYGP